MVLRILNISLYSLFYSPDKLIPHISPAYFLKALKRHILLFFTCFAAIASSQTATVSGIIKGTDGEPIEKITIGVKEDPGISANTNEKGSYVITVAAGKLQTLVFY